MTRPKLFDNDSSNFEVQTGDAGMLILRATTCAAAALALVVIPVYQLIEIFAGRTPTELQWMHAAWRTPVVLLALAALSSCVFELGEKRTHLMLRLVAASVMIMMFGLFTTDALHPAGDPEQMARGIIMATFAVSLLSLQGGREVLVYFGVPFALSLAWLALHGADLLETIYRLADPLMMLAIAMIASELFYRIRSQQFALQRALHRLASIDVLTGLHNRRDLESRLAEEMSRSRRHDQPMSIAIGDLDHFKRVNDNYGHAVGDDVLRAVGERIRENLRTEDLAVRWGGEEFLLLLPNTDETQAVQAAEKIRQAIAERPVACGDQRVSVTVSFGVAQLRDDDEIIRLIRRADDAMYRAKSAGRNRVCA
ncbi:MAG: GGDEF domain-containing protein [Xanthomonadales bacterium]|nr:GGDEF domain-containing protein [Xanthomonadales bacterium]